MARYGIERLAVYPATMALNIADLCAARGLDTAKVQRDLMTEERAVSPPFEDTVTMAVNAATGLLSPEESASVELLVAVTESAVDQEKPLSAWVHRWIGLPSSCRHFEIKHACYAGTAAVRTALAFLAERDDPAARALIVGADASLIGFGEPYEPALGACAFAILLSANPALLEIGPGESGVFAREMTDVIRPALTVETGNSELSVLCYLDALEGAYDDFVRRCGARAFKRHLYHLPFAGMGLQAHRTVAALADGADRRAARADFDIKVAPSLAYSRRIGGSYSASLFVALASLMDHDDDVHPGDPIAVFSYGSGSCGEFYAATIGADARAVSAAAEVKAALDARQRITVGEYEASERARIAAMGAETFAPPDIAGLYANYAGSGRLVLDHIARYERHYRRA